MKDTQIIEEQVKKGMGFVPNSIYEMAKKPNVFGAFSMLMVNIRGFSSTPTSPFTGIKIMLKNMKWLIKAKKESHLEVPLYLKDLIAHVSSNASGCRYCQAHTAYTAHRNGVAIEKLQKVWEFQTSDLFSAKEKAALNFAFAAGSVPNQVTQEHHNALKQHFTEKQIIEIMSTIAIFGFLNRWNDSMVTPLEDLPYEFAQEHLSGNWEAGKHK